jgi:hypothetical protein
MFFCYARFLFYEFISPFNLTYHPISLT